MHLTIITFDPSQFRLIFFIFKRTVLINFRSEVLRQEIHFT